MPTFPELLSEFQSLPKMQEVPTQPLWSNERTGIPSQAHKRRPLEPSLPQLWIMPAFGARPHVSNKVEVDFYGYSLWAAIVNICPPFGIFYPMRAVCSLWEVYVLS